MSVLYVFVTVTHHSITSYTAMDGYLLGGLCKPGGASLCGQSTAGWSVWRRYNRQPADYSRTAARQ